MVVTAAIVLLCVALIYARQGSHPGYLFFFLPVAAAAVVLGAWVVGWGSEGGGSLSLTQGLGGRAIQAIEEQGRRTGQDIHDGIAQHAAAAYIEAEVLSEVTAGSAPEVRDQVARVKHTLSLLATEARAMAGSLRPPDLGPEEFSQNFTKMVDDFPPAPERPPSSSWRGTSAPSATPSASASSGPRRKRSGTLSAMPKQVPCGFGRVRAGEEPISS